MREGSCLFYLKEVKQVKDLDEKDVQIADAVWIAYEEAEGGSLREWVQEAVLRDFQERALKGKLMSFVDGMEAIVLTVLSKMIKEGTSIRMIKEVK